MEEHGSGPPHQGHLLQMPAGVDGGGQPHYVAADSQQLCESLSALAAGGGNGIKCESFLPPDAGMLMHEGGGGVDEHQQQHNQYSLADVLQQQMAAVVQQHMQHDAAAAFGVVPADVGHEDGEEMAPVEQTTATGAPFKHRRPASKSKSGGSGGGGPGRPLTADRRRPYPCNQCTSRFGSKMELEEHQNSHTGHKPFECDICRARFNRRSTLWNHKRIHSDTKPFNCAVCHMTFKWKNSLKCHKEMHARKNETTPGDGINDELATTYAAATRRQMLTTDNPKGDPNAPIFESTKSAVAKAEASDASAEYTWPTAAANATFSTPGNGAGGGGKVGDGSATGAGPKRPAAGKKGGGRKRAGAKIRQLPPADDDGLQQMQQLQQDQQQQHALGLLQMQPGVIVHEGECASAAAVIATSDAGTVSVSAQFAAVDHEQSQHLLHQQQPLVAVLAPAGGDLTAADHHLQQQQHAGLLMASDVHYPFDPQMIDILRQHPMLWNAAGVGKQDAGAAALAGYALEEGQHADSLFAPAVASLGQVSNGYYAPQYSYYPPPQQQQPQPSALHHQHQQQQQHQVAAAAAANGGVVLPTVPSGADVMDEACSVLIANGRALPANQW